MKSLGNLSPTYGSNRSTKRLGRGPGSGQGKTSGKGHKGQKARKGGGVAPGFEGGQTPLYRRIPKHGFTNKRNMKHYSLVKLDSLNRFDDGSMVTKESLKKAGLIKNLKNPVKILANGDLSKKLILKVEKATQTAISAIESKGGKLEEI